MALLFTSVAWSAHQARLLTADRGLPRVTVMVRPGVSFLSPRNNLPGTIWKVFSMLSSIQNKTKQNKKQEVGGAMKLQVLFQSLRQEVQIPFHSSRQLLSVRLFVCVSVRSIAHLWRSEGNPVCHLAPGTGAQVARPFPSEPLYRSGSVISSESITQNQRLVHISCCCCCCCFLMICMYFTKTSLTTD